MINPTNASFNLCFRWAKAPLWSREVLTVLLPLGMLGILSATSVSAVELVSINKDGTNSGASHSYNPVISADGRFVVFFSNANDLVATDTNGEYDVFLRDLQSETTALISVNKDGIDSGAGSSGTYSVNADGRFVAFSSDANDLVATDTNGEDDVFVRDLLNGTTTLVSANKEGTDSGNGHSSFPVISADGRFVAFHSDADDLVAADTNGAKDVFVRDLQSGTTTLASVNKDGNDSGYGSSDDQVISADGRFVAFSSDADDLVATDTNGAWDVFVRDLQNGTTTLVSINKDGSDSGAGSSRREVISADGRFVAFSSRANDLVATDTNGGGDVFVRDIQNGTTTLVSINKDGTDSGGGAYPMISADGRFVAFLSVGDNLVETDTNGTQDVFVRDLQSGTTTLATVNKDGTDSGTGLSYQLGLSADGRVVSFLSYAKDLVPGVSNNLLAVFVRDLQTGITTMASANKAGTSSGNGAPYRHVISADGGFVAFSSNSSDLVDIDRNGAWDVFAFEIPKAPQGCDCNDPSAINGTSGQDFLYGTAQADILCGFEGNDFIAGVGGDDCIDGGDGNDWIYGGHGNDTIFGRAGNDVVYGHRGNDEINGNGDEDYLFGGVGDDKLDGGEGYDWLFCGSGTDEGVGEYLWECEH